MLCLMTGSNWDREKLARLYPLEMVNDIEAIDISKLGLPNLLIWSQNVHGVYACTEGYNFLCKDSHDTVPPRIRYLDFPWKDFWKLKVPYKILLFSWELLHDAIPTTETLNWHHIPIRNGCQFCDCTVEDNNHVFLWCPFAQAIWFGSKPSLKPTKARSFDISCWLRFWINQWRKDK